MINKDGFAQWISDLALRMEKGLPGQGAHEKMAPMHRKSLSESELFNTGYRTAAVLALLVPDPINSIPRIVLIERSEGPVSHSGQISFPGGKREGDEDLLVTALREANEELGIQANQVSLLGGLTSLYIPPSNFLVHPFLGYMNEIPEFILSEAEVKRVLLLPLSSFLDQGNVSIEVFKSSNGSTVEAPTYRIDDVTIWGATAMMMAEISSLIRGEI
ncbi:MAG: CoA pyrophosphatase [Bacteroidia bacterium]|jgi:8-oxo-dGTP pyrophosphatase MutT (NUDIX family)|nr:CoA pyrophosphatase [Bacteroidia bacterium]MBP7245072.1 CoA pyrophosphatase [Bacteroidia bacterium]